MKAHDLCDVVRWPPPQSIVWLASTLLSRAQVLVVSPSQLRSGKTWSSTDPAPPSINIYEREEQHQSQREGHALSVRADPMSGGTQALQRLSLLDEVLDVSITGAGLSKAAFASGITSGVKNID